MWPMFQQNMGEALGEMRIDLEKKVDLSLKNNPLFEKRMRKTTTGPRSSQLRNENKPPQQTNNETNKASNKFNNDMIIEEYSREDSAMMITPTNSRPSSPNRK